MVPHYAKSWRLELRWPIIDVVTPYNQLDLSIVPGPQALVEPAVSFDTHEVVEYAPELVAQAVLSIPNARLLSTSDATWWDWKARCDTPDGWIEIDMTLFDVEPPSWGGSGLTVECGPASLLDFWCRLRVTCPAAWLHDADCNLYSPESFRNLYL